VKRRDFLAGLAAGATLGALGARPGAAFGPSAAFGVGRIQYDGNWEPRPSALPRLLQQLEQRTSILTDDTCPVVAPESGALFDTPFAVFSGDRGFPPLSEAARSNLEIYLRAGGTLLFDSSEDDPDGEFYRSVVREVGYLVPDEPFNRIPSSHVLFKSFYLVDDAPGRSQVAPYLEGCSQDGRLLLLYSHNDLQGAWSRDNFGNWLYEVHPGGERQREMAFRMGVNIAMYTLCLDYKEDQVHVPFILHRRQWRID